jgi:hypothetical protein
MVVRVNDRCRGGSAASKCRIDKPDFWRGSARIEQKDRTMKTISKTLVGTIAAAAVAASLATPAAARDGALATVGVSIGHYGDNYGPQRWGQSGWGQGSWARGNQRAAVDQCVRISERTAARGGYGRANVTDIRDVRQTGRGYEVRGRIAVNAMGRDWRNDGIRGL